MFKAANKGYTTATDLADNMVKNLKITFITYNIDTVYKNKIDQIYISK